MVNGASLSEIDRLVTKTKGRVERVTAIRRWAFFRVPLAFDPECLIAQESASAEWPLEQLFENFDSGAGGVWASGMAQVLARLYQRFDLNSAVLHLGDPAAGFLHMVTLVDAGTLAEPLVTVQDAYFNWTVTTANGRLMDYPGAVSALCARPYRAARMQMEPGVKTVLRKPAASQRHPTCEKMEWYWGDTSWTAWLKERTGRGALINCLLLPVAVEGLPSGQPGRVLRRSIANAAHQAGISELVLVPGGSSTVVQAVSDRSGGQPTFDLQRVRPPRRTPLRPVVTRPAEIAPPEQLSSDVTRVFPGGRLSEAQRAGFETLLDQPCSARDHLYRRLALVPRHVLDRTYANDPWLRNFIANLWEFEIGLTAVSTYPWDVDLPVFDGPDWMALTQLSALAPVLRYARQLTLTGLRDPLEHPRCDTLLRKLAKILDSRAAVRIVTQVQCLHDRLDSLAPLPLQRVDILLTGAVSGLETRRLSAVIGRLRDQNAGNGNTLQIVLTMPVTARTLPKVQATIRLAEKLGADAVALPVPAALGHVALWLPREDGSVSEHPEAPNLIERACMAVEAATVPVHAAPASWRDRTDPGRPCEDGRKVGRTRRGRRASFPRGEALDDAAPDVENPIASRRGRVDCAAVYQRLSFRSTELQIAPCPGLSVVPGHTAIAYDGSYPFFEAWNSPAMMELRCQLNEGSLYYSCMSCHRVS